MKYGLLVPIQIQMEVSGANSALLVQVKTSAYTHASPLASNPRGRDRQNWAETTARNMIYKQHREISISLVAKFFQKCDKFCCLFVAYFSDDFA